MLITTLLEVHQDEALPRDERIIGDLNIGDAFLYRHHSMYRNLRDVYWALGYRFGTDDFCYLYELPLFSLDLILQARVIPVRDTVSPLRDLTRRFPGAEYTDLAFETSLAYPINHVMHHEVHCIADHVTEELLGSWETLGQSPMAVLRVLTCESFGNAVDLLANVEAQRWSEEGQALFTMNNLVLKTKEEIEPHGRLLERLGPKVGVQVVALFFLFRNLLAEEIDAEFLERALHVFGIDYRGRAEELIALFDQTTLTAGFRINTTTRYFRYLGFEFEDLLALYDFDLLELAEQHPGLAQTFDAMGDVIASGKVPA